MLIANGGSFGRGDNAFFGNSAASTGGEVTLPSLAVRVLTVVQISPPWGAR